jgi:hypothetical protein
LIFSCSRGHLFRQEWLEIPVGVFSKKIEAPAAAGVYLLKLTDEAGRSVWLRWVVVG